MALPGETSIMDLSKILKPEAVKVVSSASSKKRLLHAIAEVAESAYGLNPTRVVEALLERENLGPTGVGNGVALPHARLKVWTLLSVLLFGLKNPLISTR